MCFGCGPSNPSGLRIRSFRAADGVVCEWMPSPHDSAVPEVVCGGIVSTLLDCHAAMAACVAFIDRDGLSTVPPLVTRDLTLQLRRPTPIDRPVTMAARVTDLQQRHATVEAQMSSGDVVTANFSATFVIPRPPGAGAA